MLFLASINLEARVDLFIFETFREDSLAKRKKSGNLNKASAECRRNVKADLFDIDRLQADLNGIALDEQLVLSGRHIVETKFAHLGCPGPKNVGVVR